MDRQPYPDQLLQAARQQGKPVIIDFYAIWCTPCRELEDITFHDPEVVKRAGADSVMIKLDTTPKRNPVHDRLLGQHGIKEVPTVLFLDGQGIERADLRRVDFLPPEQFGGRMATVMKKTP